jgi:long-subunit acyl-CoA synthetase (AMP-forming)
MKSPLQSFFDRERLQADEICFVQPYPDGRVDELTWAQVGRQVRSMAAYLTSLNLPEQSTIALMSNNCAHWIMADIAIWMAGHVSVPLYPVLTAKSIRQIMEHSEAKVLFVGKLSGWEAMQPGIPDDVSLITLPIHPESLTLDANWNAIIGSIEPLQKNQDRPLGDLATIIYTSGTTGLPKGVMHSFSSIASVGTLTGEMYATDSNDRMLSYLPLAHVAERAAVETNQLYRGFRVYFSNSLETFSDDLKRARPTLFFAVPRIWQKLQQRVHEQVSAKKLNRLLSVPLVSKFFSRKIATAIGLDAVRIGISGAAPLSTSILTWYQRLGVPILEGYAMSENFAYSHSSRMGQALIGSVGKANPEVQCKISEHGEVLVKSPTTMMGYYKQAEITAESLDEDGYLRTGDKGTIDEHGYLTLTGRIKEIFKTSKGKYVAPAPIEDRILRSYDIEQVCVTGADLPQPIALITLSEESLIKLEGEDHSGVKTALHQEFEATLRNTNAGLDKHENLNCFVVLNHGWTVENGYMTPTLKIKRAAVEAANLENFETWSAMPDTVIWL